VIVAADTFLTHAAELFDAAPIRWLCIVEPGTALADLAACPYLGRVSVLRFGSEPLLRDRHDSYCS
jgi:hypothetical protein